MGIIHDAVRNGDLKKVETLLAEDPTAVNSSDDDLYTPLHLAILDDNVSMVRMLLKRGADPQIESPAEVPPIDMASGRNREEIIGLVSESFSTRRPLPAPPRALPLYCPRCGTENADSTEFCVNCGGSLEAAKQYASEHPIPKRPDNHLITAMLVTAFCCLIPGIVGIAFAAQVDGSYNRGDYEGAVNASDTAGMWVSIAFWLGIAGWIFFLIYNAFTGVVSY